jgi:oligoribonuclease
LQVNVRTTLAPRFDDAPLRGTDRYMSATGKLVWIDLEMTGLDPDQHAILEIATLITDADLNEIAVGPVLAIRHSLSTLQAMDEWNRNTHSGSGLWRRSLESGVSVADAEAQTLAFIQGYVGRRESPLCGNSICQDRRFLARGMPMLEAWLHYRNLDVSTLKELRSRWAPNVPAFKKQSLHSALADIRESVAELRHYRGFMGAMGG